MGQLLPGAPAASFKRAAEQATQASAARFMIYNTQHKPINCSVAESEVLALALSQRINTVLAQPTSHTS